MNRGWNPRQRTPNSEDGSVQTQACVGAGRRNRDIPCSLTWLTAGINILLNDVYLHSDTIPCTILQCIDGIMSVSLVTHRLTTSFASVFEQKTRQLGRGADQNPPSALCTRTIGNPSHPVFFFDSVSRKKTIQRRGPKQPKKKKKKKEKKNTPISIGMSILRGRGGEETLRARSAMSRIRALINERGTGRGRQTGVEGGNMRSLVASLAAGRICVSDARCDMAGNVHWPRRLVNPQCLTMGEAVGIIDLAPQRGALVKRRCGKHATNAVRGFGTYAVCKYP